MLDSSRRWPRACSIIRRDINSRVARPSRNASAISVLAPARSPFYRAPTPHVARVNVRAAARSRACCGARRRVSCLDPRKERELPGVGVAGLNLHARLTRRGRTVFSLRRGGRVSCGDRRAQSPSKQRHTRGSALVEADGVIHIAAARRNASFGGMRQMIVGMVASALSNSWSAAASSPELIKRSPRCTRHHAPVSASPAASAAARIASIAPFMSPCNSRRYETRA